MSTHSSLGPCNAATLVEQTFTELAKALVAQRVRRLVVAGGEASGAVVAALGRPSAHGATPESHGHARSERNRCCRCSSRATLAAATFSGTHWRSGNEHGQHRVGSARNPVPHRARYERGLTHGSMAMATTSPATSRPRNLSCTWRRTYQQRPSSGAVAHLHSTHSTAVSVLAELDPHHRLPPLITYYVMRVGSPSKRTYDLRKSVRDLVGLRLPPQPLFDL